MNLLPLMVKKKEKEEVAGITLLLADGPMLFFFLSFLFSVS